MATKRLKIQFTEFIPEELREGVIYISMEYATASHKCACGCGQEVVTPFTPTDWKLIYDGESVTLSPSIGNWSYPCRAHYLIRNNVIVWASDMSQEAIEAGRRRDKGNKARHYGQRKNEALPPNSSMGKSHTAKSAASGGILSTIARFFGFK
jgi:hypothetical protein